MRIKIKFCFSLFWLVSSSYVLAQTVPPLINYQGRLANPDGSFLATANYTLTFRVYDATNGGTPVWGPQIFDGSFTTGHGPQIPVVNGFFNAMLGPVDAFGNSLGNAFNATNRFVEITIGNNSPITPRQQFLTTPYAFQAQNAATMNNADWSTVFGTNDPVNGKIPGSRIAAGAISSNQLAPAAVNQSNLALRPTGTNVPAGGIAVSRVCTSWQNNSQTMADADNLSIALQTTGRPVLITCNGTNDGGRLIAYWQNTACCATVTFQIVRDNSTVVSSYQLKGQFNGTTQEVGFVPSSSVSAIDFPPPGPHTYKLQAAGLDGNSVPQVKSTLLLALEL